MIISGLYALELLLLIALQGSVAGILFPEGGSIPGVLLAASVSWILVCGFRRGWLLSLVLIGAYFVLVTEGSWFAAAYTLLAVYGASYLSRRYLFEHRGVGGIISAGYVGAAAALGTAVLPAVMHIRAIMEGASSGVTVGWVVVITTFLSSAAAFLILLPVLRRSEKITRYYRERDSLGRIRI